MIDVTELTEKGTITPDLKNYMVRKNTIMQAFGHNTFFDLENLTESEASRLAACVNFDLMPDNLTMSGQLAPDQIILKQNECVAVMNTLHEVFNPSQGGN